MDSLLNTQRPPVFCPGCAHDRVVHALDKAFSRMALAGNQVAIVSDIGCSGLFDTFFNTHAFHGLHGRALTYATGLKMARPDLHVVVTMGDGGLGIGGAHLLSACRRNLDLTLLVLNNFNYGMTGGQCSSTTPPDAVVGSGFLNQLEKPIDVCQVAGAAGAPDIRRASSYQKDLPEVMAEAIGFKGFSVIDMWGVCPGRYTKRNPLSPKAIEASLAEMPPVTGFAEANARREYGEHYRELAAGQKRQTEPAGMTKTCDPPFSGRREILILGKAGQRIVTAAEIMGLSGIAGGLHASQKSDYPITVLRGHSVSELILSDDTIDYTGISNPDVVIALADEGVARRKKQLENLRGNPLLIKEKSIAVPECAARIVEVDFKAQKIKPQDWALASLSLLARRGGIITGEMLAAGLAARFKGDVLASATELVDRVADAV
jgi:pyruvate/2-oxoacid:ferredoxin oxidoreductase beta subunit/Pyruvate/2-oxoacid:ferredoxin oxidoreductase gamma subunit